MISKAIKRKMSRAASEGGHLANEAQDMSEKFQQGVVTGTANDTGTQGGAKAVQFQRKFGGADPMDNEMNQRMQLMDEDGMTPFGQVYYDDKVGKWLERKAQVEEVANLDAWFNSNFNKNNLADRQFAQQIYPVSFAY